MSLDLFRYNKTYYKQYFDITDQLHFNKQLDYTYKPYFFNYKDDELWRYEAEFQGCFYNHSLSNHILGLNMGTKRNVFVPMSYSFKFPSKKEAHDFRPLYRSGYLLNNSWDSSTHSNVKNNNFYFNDLFYFNGLKNNLGIELSSAVNFINLFSSRDRSSFPIFKDLDLRVSGYNGIWNHWTDLSKSYIYGYYFPKNYFIIANSYLHSSSFFISSFDSSIILSPSLFFESREKKKEWNLISISSLSKLFNFISLDNLFFYINIIFCFEKVFSKSVDSLILLNFYNFCYKRLGIYNFYYNSLLNINSFTYLKFKYLSKYFNINIIKYFSFISNNIDLSFLFNNLIFNNFFNKNLIVDSSNNLFLILKKVLNIKDLELKNNILHNKIFNYIKILNLYKNIKSLYKKYSFYVKYLELLIKDLLYKNNFFNKKSIFNFYNKFLDIINYNNLNLNSLVYNILNKFNNNLINLLLLGRISFSLHKIKKSIFVSGYKYREIITKKFGIINKFSFLRKGWSNISGFELGNKYTLLNSYNSILNLYVKKLFFNVKLFFNKFFSLLLQLIKFNLNLCFNFLVNFNVNVKKILFRYIYIIKKFSFKLVNRKNFLFFLDSFFFSYNIFYKFKKYTLYPYKYSFIKYKKYNFNFYVS